MNEDREARVHRSVGRPRAPEPMLTVSMKLPQSVHDKLMSTANRNDQSVSEVLRNIVVLQLK